MPKVSELLKSAMFSAFVQQGIILVLAGMILDGGRIALMCLFACAAFWIGTGVIIFRRGTSPSKMDLFLVRGGYLLLCVVSFFVGQLVWQLRGF